MAEEVVRAPLVVEGDEVLVVGEVEAVTARDRIVEVGEAKTFVRRVSIHSSCLVSKPRKMDRDRCKCSSSKKQSELQS